MKIKYNIIYKKSRNNIIIEYCKGKKVLHIGACDSPNTIDKYEGKRGPLLYREINKVCKEQLGIDLDKESIGFLKSKEKEFNRSEIKFFDMNKLENIEYKPDVIIFGEVIEHIMNLEIALKNIKKIMNKDTLLIISTPNAFYFNNFLNNIFGIEYIHKDHNLTFTYGSLKTLMKKNKLKEHNFYFTNLDSFNLKLNIFGKISLILKHFFLLISKSFSETLLIIVKNESKK